MTASFDFALALSGARRGESTALDALFTHAYPTVRQRVHQALATDLRLKRPWLASAFSTGDVVQEVFRTALTDLSGFAGQDEAAFMAYLTAIVKHRLIDAIRFHEALRRDRRRDAAPVEEEDPLELDTRGPMERVARAEQLERFCAVVAQLPERERRLLSLRFEKDAPFAEIADALSFPSPDAARKAFHAAQARLLVRLRKAGLDLGKELS